MLQNCSSHPHRTLASDHGFPRKWPSAYAVGEALGQNEALFLILYKETLEDGDGLEASGFFLRKQHGV